MNVFDDSNTHFLIKDSKQKKGRKKDKKYCLSFLYNLFPNRKEKFQLDGVDCVLLMIFMGLGLLTRIIRIQYPKNVIYNENLYGQDVNNYINGNFFVDINPPLPKLILAGVAKFARYSGELSFKDKSKYKSMFYVMLRFIPAFFGALCTPVSYLIMRVLDVGYLGASAASIMISSDIMFILQERHFTGDGIVHFFSVLAIFSMFLFEKCKSLSAFLFEAVCLGLASACKYTTGGIILLALIRQFPLSELNLSFSYFMKNSGPSISKSGIIILIILFIHYIIYSIHLIILPFNDIAPDDIPSNIAESLVSKEKPDWEKKQASASLIARIFSLILYDQKNSFSANYSSSYSSPWWSWPLCLGKGIRIWEDENRVLFAIGNIFVWYFSFFGVIFSFIGLLFSSYIFSNLSTKRNGLLCGYIFSFLPFGLMNRYLCIFHYLIPLTFGIYTLCLMIDDLCNDKYKGFFYLMIIHFSLIGYLVWYPFAYGIHIDDFDFLIWNKAWV